MEEKLIYEVDELLKNFDTIEELEELEDYIVIEKETRKLEEECPEFTR